jgi:hypothetical protein
MITALSGLLGFLSPFIPELINFFKRKQDIAAEERMLRLQAELADRKTDEKLKIIETQAQAQTTAAMLKGAYKERKSVAVALLENGTRYPVWLIAPAFYLFVLLDVFISAVRPLVTIGVVVFYAHMKAGIIEAVVAQHGGSGIGLAWTETDAAILMTVIGYWFGQRVIQRAKQ